ncbi:hypothetical protein CY35_03G028600 [Sphagnum magellanicum]|nr:hypothetical protein CY35_03G028600 [Sphagnum magellanicum]
MDAWCGSLQSTTNSGTTGNSRRESRTNDGVMAVLTSTHMQASVASQLSPSQSAVYSSPPLGQLSVGMPGTLSTVSSQPSPTLLQHQQHQITSASSNLCHHVLVRGIISSWVGSLSLQSYIYLVLQNDVPRKDHVEYSILFWILLEWLTKEIFPRFAGLCHSSSKTPDCRRGR